MLCRVDRCELYNGHAPSKVTLYCAGKRRVTINTTPSTTSGDSPRHARLDFTDAQPSVAHGTTPMFGGCAFMKVVNCTGVTCDIMAGAFSQPLAHVLERLHNDNNKSTFTLPIVNYALKDELKRQNGPESAVYGSTQGSIMLTVSRSGSSDAVPSYFPLQYTPAQHSERIFNNYIVKYYDTCFKPPRPSVPKLRDYHVPSFSTYTGVDVPASAYLQWRHNDADAARLQKTMSHIVHSVSAAVASNPLLVDERHYVELVGDLTRTRGYPTSLDLEHTAALQTTVEVLTQLSTSAPYVADFGFARSRGGGGNGYERADDDLYCPVADTEGTDCEDGAKLACELKRLIQEHGNMMGRYGALSTLLGYFAHFVAISYCADPDPDQTTRDKGLCHVVCILIPKPAAAKLTSNVRRCSFHAYPRVLGNRDHWIHTTPLIVPESTALTDSMLYPPTKEQHAVRLRDGEARSLFSAGGEPYSGMSFMTRESFEKHRKRGAVTMPSYCASSFYQWITDLWTDQCESTFDLLPVYVTKNGGGGGGRTWGVRFADLSAQILINSGVVSMNDIATVYGNDVRDRLQRHEIKFEPRVTDAPHGCLQLIRNIMAYHMPDYAIVPAVDWSGRHKYVRAYLRECLAQNKHIRDALTRPVRKGAKANYIRFDVYAETLYEASAGRSMSCGRLMRNLNEQLNPANDTPFYAARLYENEIFVDRFPSKITFIVYYDENALLSASPLRVNNGSSGSAMSSASRGNYVV